MFVHNTKLVDMVVCRYQCQYGPNDFKNIVKDITQNYNASPKI